MKKITVQSYRIAIALLCVLTCSPGAWSQQADVALHVQVSRNRSTHTHDRSHPSTSTAADVVAWLVPLQPASQPPAPRPVQQYTLVQKDKQFTPHLLVVPTGSNVDFPNMDPFFHNVFSLFNGKRFDLGLYEAHTHRAVRFDREGVSYIFCNIHPEMGAVIVSVSTPYYGISDADGTLTLHDVPSGSYRLYLWAEEVTKEDLAAASRTIEIKQGNVQIGPILLKSSGNSIKQHTNKFGEPYQPASKDPY
jgi:plastocyanin